MKRKYRKPEQIVKLLRQAEAGLAQGRSVEEICRELATRHQRQHALLLAQAVRQNGSRSG